jgi:hypothetical protein
MHAYWGFDAIFDRDTPSSVPGPAWMDAVEQVTTKYNGTHTHTHTHTRRVHATSTLSPDPRSVARPRCRCTFACSLICKTGPRPDLEPMTTTMLRRLLNFTLCTNSFHLSSLSDHFPCSTRHCARHTHALTYPHPHRHQGLQLHPSGTADMRVGAGHVLTNASRAGAVACRPRRSASSTSQSNSIVIPAMSFGL